MLTTKCLSSYSYSACRNREQFGNFQNKSVSSPFSWVHRYILFFPTWRGEEGLFWGVKEGHPHCEITPKSLVVIRDENVSFFVKIEIILLFLCFLLDQLTNKHCRTWSSMINLRIDSRTYQKWRVLLSARQMSSNYLQPSREHVLGKYDAVTLTMLYLKVLHDMVPQNS